MLRRFGAGGQARAARPAIRVGVASSTIASMTLAARTCPCRRRRRAVRCRDRAAATRPTRRSTRWSPSACSCRNDRRRARGVRDLPRARRAGAAARRGQLAMRADGRRGAGHRSQQASQRRSPHSIATRMTVDRRARRRARLAQRVAASRTGCGFRSTSARRRRRRSAAWPATIRAARARSPTATWCTTCSRSTRCWPTAPKRASAPEREMAGRAAADRATLVRGLARRSASASATRSSATCRRCCAASAATTSTSVNPQSERPYTADGSVNFAHLLVGSEGTLAWSRELTLKLAPLPAHRALGVVNFPTLYRAMEMRAAHRRRSSLPRSSWSTGR